MESGLAVARAEEGQWDSKGYMAPSEVMEGAEWLVVAVRVEVH